MALCNDNGRVKRFDDWAIRSEVTKRVKRSTTIIADIQSFEYKG